MSPTTKFDATALAVLVVAIAGFYLFGQANSTDDATAAPSGAPEASGSPPPVIAELPAVDLEPGTYRATRGTGTFTLTVPSGWTASDPISVVRKRTDPGDASSVALAAWWVPRVYTDSCHWHGSVLETPTRAELVAALAAQTGHHTVGPNPTTLGGYPAMRFEFSVTDTFDLSTCDGAPNGGPDAAAGDPGQNVLWLWPDATGALFGGTPLNSDETIAAYVVDVDGSKQVVGGISWDHTSAADFAELQAVLDSLHFER